MLYSVSEGYRTFLRYKIKDERLKIGVASKEDTKGIKMKD